MSIAAKINLLITTLAVVASLTLTFFVGQRDYSYQRDAIILRASTFVGSQPQLQQTFYFRDASELRNTAGDLLALSPAIRRIAFFDVNGDLLVSVAPPWAAEERTPPLRRLRDGLTPLEQGVVTRRGGVVPEELELLAKISLGERSSSLTIPVFSVVNPGDRGLGREDFAAALVYPELVSSLHVIGYVEVALSSTLIWSQTLPTITLSAGLGLLIVFVFWVIARLTTRRITAPLSVLARVADDIAAGRQTDTIPVRGSGEVRDIAQVFNGIIAGLHQHAKKMDTDRRILNLKIDERTQQLSQHREALSEAEKNVSAARDQVRHLAYFDTLTSLPNRKLFTEQLTLLLRLAHRSRQHVGLLLVDIDQFKRINDSLGASAGDRLLREVAQRLAAGARDSDILHRRADRDISVMDLSRMGGDEFTVVLNNVESHEAARRVADRLAADISSPYHIDQQEIVITCSIGIAVAPDHGNDVEALLRAANTAMVSAKKQGRNRVALYDASMEAANLERLQLETDLRRAVERDELLLHFQPQVHGRSGEVHGAETLVRWNHPSRGLVPPFQWIPIAEELGLIDEIGDWVLKRACADLEALRAAGRELPKISVNVSALQFRDDFVASVEEALKLTGLPPDSLQLELTEGVMISDQQSTLALVHRLKALGVRLSIDDFGTGYSSLSYLTRLPLDELKIDRSFVVGLSEGGPAVELVRAIIAMGKSLGLDIVVEGVETVEELQFFREQGVDIIQGFLVSPPIPLERLRAVLETGHYTAQLDLLSRKLAAGELRLEQA